MRSVFTVFRMDCREKHLKYSMYDLNYCLKLNITHRNTVVLFIKKKSFWSSKSLQMNGTTQKKLTGILSNLIIPFIKVYIQLLRYAFKSLHHSCLNGTANIKSIRWACYIYLPIHCKILPEFLACWGWGEGCGGKGWEDGDWREGREGSFIWSISQVLINHGKVPDLWQQKKISSFSIVWFS